MFNTDNVSIRGYGLTLLRIVIGIIFLAHGWQKLFVMGIPGVTGFFTQIGIPAPALSAGLVATAEVVGGLALIVGIFTTIAGIALAVDMAGAILFVKLGGGLFAPKGYELELTLLVASLAIALSGPGPFAAAGWLRGRRSQERA